MDQFFKRLNNKVDMIVESLDEAVNIRDISPEARAEVLKQKELHRKTNVKKDKELSPELHSMSPLKKAEKEALAKKVAEDLKRSEDIIYYRLGLDTRVETTKDDFTRPKTRMSVYDKDKATMSATAVDTSPKKFSDKKIHPDVLWRDADKNKSNIITFMYFPNTDELFYMNEGDKYNDDPYNLRNYYIDNPQNPLEKYAKKDFNVELKKLGYFDRTHSGMLTMIRNIFKVPNLRDNFKITDVEVAGLRKYITEISNKLIIGRTGHINDFVEVVSFWNAIKPELARKIVRELSQRTGKKKFDKIYLPDKNISR